MDFERVKKILIIKLRHVGDVLLTVPTIRAIKETLPDSQIVVLVNKGTEDMLVENPIINEVITYDRKIKKLQLLKMIKNELEFIKQLRSKSFDMVVDLTSGDRPAIYSFLSGARYRIAYNPEGRGFLGKSFVYTHLGKRLEERNHIISQNLHLVRQFGMNTDDLTVNIFFSDEDRQFVDRILSKSGVSSLDPMIQIHPTSRWLFKCWKDEYTAEIIDYCENSLGIRTVITSAPDKCEMDRVKNILGRIRSSTVDLSGELTLKQLAALSNRTSLFFGVDSAPMHIAAAVGTPVVALFGPSGAFDWGPWDNSQTQNRKPYPKKNGIQRFGMHTVVQKNWDCIPCGKDGCEGSKRSECLEVIEVEDVKNVLMTKVQNSKAHDGLLN